MESKGAAARLDLYDRVRIVSDFRQGNLLSFRNLEVEHVAGREFQIATGRLAHKARLGTDVAKLDLHLAPPGFTMLKPFFENALPALDRPPSGA